MKRPNSYQMPIYFVWFGFLFMLSHAHFLVGQSPEQFSRLGIKDGLSQLSIYSVMQDHQGFMWFGTLNGLNRYDGRSVRTYRSNQHKAGLHSAYILSLLEDKNQVLWVGTMQGLHYYDKNNDEFHYIKTSSKLGHIHDIQYAPNGRLWLGCANGLFLFNPMTKKVEKKVIDDYVTAVLVARNQDIWIGTIQEGIWVLNKKQHVKHRFKNSTSPNTLSHNRITRIYQSKDGTIRVGTEGGGMCEFVPETKEFVTYQYSDDKKTVAFDVVWDILQVKNQIWLATTQGIFIYDALSRNFVKRIEHDIKNSKSISDNHLLRLYEDRAGNVWIGTAKGGANMYNARQNSFHLISHNRGGTEILSQNGVMSIYEETGKMWFGIDGGGLNVYDSATKITTHYRHDSANPKSIGADAVLSIYKDKAGIYWVGTWGGGLNKFDPKTQTFERFQHDSNEPFSLPSNNIWRVFEDSRGNFWVVMNEKGIALFDRETGKIIRQIIPRNDKITMNGFFNIYEDSHANIYFSGWNGLVRYNLDAELFQIYTSHEKDRKSLSGDYPFCVFEDSKKRIWIGTSGGLAQFHLEDETFTSYGVKDGLIHPEVVGILEDESGFLWLSTKQGLNRFDTDNQSFMSFSMNDVSQEGEFSIGSYCKLRNGDLLFGSSSGITQLTPSDITLNLTIPPIFFTDFQLFNKSVTPRSTASPLSKSITETQKITLNHKQSVFTIDFVALSFTHPERNRYKYKLEGFDDEWRDGSRQSATYTNLDAGKYRFRVMASNNHGIWNEKGKTLEIIILPPWWNTIPARIALILLIVILFIGFNRYRTWQFEERQHILKQLVDERTAQLQDKQAEVLERNQKLEAQQQALNQASKALERQHKKTTDSIRYAQTIQDAVLPSAATLQKYHRQHFLIYQPKDIVAGDFYWVGKEQSWTFTVVADCTGHGVPGAFMSMIGSALLNEIIAEKQILSPAQILHELNKDIQKALKQAETDNMDGMDIVLCATQPFDNQNVNLVFCGAKNSLYYFMDNKLYEIRGSRKAIGGKQYEHKTFDNQELILSKNTILYLMTDGYIDQHNVAREKFGKVRFQKLISKIGHLPLSAQKEILQERLQRHQQDQEQRDDITVLGITV